MCTRVLWPDADDAVLVGRNMDYHRDTGSNLWVFPRGIARNDGVDGTLTWTSKYGSLTASGLDLLSVDGMNEAGLAGHDLWLAESDYGTYDKSLPALAISFWLQYFLDNFATVADAVAWVRETNVQVVPLTDPSTGEVAVLHIALEDASGDSAIIEYVNGEPVIHHSRDYRVMTNSPTYDQQLELLRQWEGLGGDKPVPGTTLASDRFARAAYYSERLPQPSSQLQAIAALASVMRNVAQPFRTPDPGKPDASQTIWTTVADLTNQRYVFESTTAPNVVWVDFTDLDFTEGAPQLRLDLHSTLALAGGVAGNVSQKFTDAGPMTFLTVSILEGLRKKNEVAPTSDAPQRESEFANS